MKQGVPISTDEYLEFKMRYVPPLPPIEIFGVINDLLIEYPFYYTLVIKLLDIIDRMKARCPKLTYSNYWLGFQDYYRSKGWDIQYDPKNQTFEFSINK